MMLRHLLTLVTVLSLLVGSASAGSDWDPEKWKNGSTLRFQTTGSGNEEQWSTVWYVVLYGDVYVRLGTTEAELIDNNVGRPYVRVRIGIQEFGDVRADPAPDMAGLVNEAMKEKYPMDFLFRFLPHPMTVRLRAASF